MKKYKRFINTIEKSIDTANGCYKQVLKILIGKYKNINADIEIVNYDVKKKSHFLELKNADSFFFEISVTEKQIHLIINELEEMYFFDDTFLLKFYAEILNSIFEGTYEVLKKIKDKSVLWELEFRNTDLNMRDENTASFDERLNIVEVINGIRLTQKE